MNNPGLKNSTQDFLGFVQHKLDLVQIQTFDLSHGESEECSFIYGKQKDFESIYQFAATALTTLGIEEELFDIYDSKPEPWMRYYQTPVLRDLLSDLKTSRVNIDELNLKSPETMLLKIGVEFSGGLVQDGAIYANDEFFVFYYWYTTG